MIRKACKIRNVLFTAILYLTVLSTGIAYASQEPNNTLQPQCLTYTGISKLKQTEPNLNGSNVNIAIICRSLTYTDGYPQNDYLPNLKHNCFKTTQFGFYDESNSPGKISFHSTAICSILFGQDPNAYISNLGNFSYEGITPNANANIYEFWYFLINDVLFQTKPQNDIITASLGNQFEDWWTRGIDALAAHYGTVIIAGIGNGQEVFDPPLYPAAGTNTIGVGVVDSLDSNELAIKLAEFSLAYPEHSSYGPTIDKRCKPDIVAAGNYLTADINSESLYTTTGNWSSFATPVVCGAAGLLIQKAKEEPNSEQAISSDTGNCLIKAILLNSATKLPFWHKGALTKDDDHKVPLDYIQGAGLLNALEAYNNLVAGEQKPGNVKNSGWDLSLMSNSKNERVYRLKIDKPENKTITATLVWNKHYEQVYPFKPKPQEDLDLSVEFWGIDLNDSNNNRLIDYSDSKVDNVEHIYCKTVADYTNYEVVVAVSDDEDKYSKSQQKYCLAWNIGQEQEQENSLRYDLNGDGTTNETDLLVLIRNKIKSEESPASYCIGDFNNDGVINNTDYDIFLNKLTLK